MKKFNINTVVFDLDGTLIKSHATIYEATVRTFKEFGRNVNIPKDKFYSLLGHHFTDMFEKLNIEVKDINHFIDVYKTFYFDYIDLSEPYSGVRNMLDTLKKRNKKIALLTTKGQDQAEKIIKHFSLESNFDYIMGRRPGIAHKPSAEPLLKICNELNSDLHNTLMVGDAELDIQCGKNANAITCGVTFGYRSKENLVKENPDFLIDNFNQFIDLINNSLPE